MAKPIDPVTGQEGQEMCEWCGVLPAVTLPTPFETIIACSVAHAALQKARTNVQIIGPIIR